MMRGMLFWTAVLWALPLPAQEQPSVQPLTAYEVSLRLLSPQAGEVNGDDDGFPVQDPASQKKSPGLAAVYSLLLPGMGELYVGSFSSGKYFLVAEGALWLTYAAFTVHGNSLQDDSRAYAISAAGIDPTAKDDQFYVDIGNFMTTEGYNDKKLRDREPELLYDRTQGFGWDWVSESARTTYKENRLSSETTYNNRKFIVAAIVINHLASAVNALRSAISHNKAVQQALGDLTFRADVVGGWTRPEGIVVKVSRPF